MYRLSDWHEQWLKDQEDGWEPEPPPEPWWHDNPPPGPGSDAGGSGAEEEDEEGSAGEAMDEEDCSLDAPPSPTGECRPPLALGASP